jgi:hypothetical protein
MRTDRRFALCCFAVAPMLVAGAWRGVADGRLWHGLAVVAVLAALFMAVRGRNLRPGRHSEEGDELLQRLARNAWWLS